MASRQRHPKPLTEAQLENRRAYLRNYGRENNHRWADNIAASHKRWRDANREHLIAYAKAWNEAHPERYQQNKNANNSKRRAQKVESGGTYTADEFDALCEQWGSVCLRCGEAKPLTADHIIPLSKGGGNSIENIQPLCRECNSHKGTRSTDYRPK